MFSLGTFWCLFKKNACHVLTNPSLQHLARDPRYVLWPMVWAHLWALVSSDWCFDMWLEFRRVLFRSSMAKQMEAHLHEESKLWSFIVLFQSQSRMQGGKTEESNMKNSRGQQLLDIFWVLSGVHFMYTICRFETWEVRNLMLQTVYESELK